MTCDISSNGEESINEECNSDSNSNSNDGNSIPIPPRLGQANSIPELDLELARNLITFKKMKHGCLL